MRWQWADSGPGFGTWFNLEDLFMGQAGPIVLSGSNYRSVYTTIYKYIWAKKSPKAHPKFLGFDFCYIQN